MTGTETHPHPISEAPLKIPFDSDCFEVLKKQTRLSGVGPLEGFAFNLDLSVPYIVCAIHSGSRVRSELLPFMAISERNRQAEEDTGTERIIRNCPSTLWGLDSRAEYDLNRPAELALPLTAERFWGFQVYTIPPTETMTRLSMAKYEAFYEFAGTVIRILLERFGACVVYDIHSYNIRRQMENGHSSPPTFNIGTDGIDRVKWKDPIGQWMGQLKAIRLPGRKVTVAENDVFCGKGAFCRKLSCWDENILVLSTEISKNYMDEETGSLHEPIVDGLKHALAKAVVEHGSLFQNGFCR